MNLDNSVVTFSGVPFPLRFRMVLEQGLQKKICFMISSHSLFIASDLASAMRVWNSTNNTNSFNFLIGSASDEKAFALETIRGFTQQYADNSPVEAAAT